MLRNFSHVMLYVNDVARAAKWYELHFDFKTVFVSAPNYGSLYHDGMKFRLDLHPDKNGQNVGRGARVYFTVGDLDGTIATLRTKGVAAEDPQTEGGARFASFTDCEGNTIGLCEPHRWSPGK